MSESQRRQSMKYGSHSKSRHSHQRKSSYPESPIRTSSGRPFLLPTPDISMSFANITSSLAALTVPIWNQKDEKRNSSPGTSSIFGKNKKPTKDDNLKGKNKDYYGKSYPYGGDKTKENLSSLSFDDDVIHSLRAVKQFEDSGLITSISFSSDGDYLISSSQSDKIGIYNMKNGTMGKIIPSKKYGVDLISFTNNTKSVVHASTKIDDTIRYLNIETNQYIRYFPGHNKRVTQLKVDPTGGSILSSGKDQRLFLWDVRSPNCQGLLNMNGIPVCDFDPEGLIFAVSLNSKTIKLYDLRTFDKGPFSTLTLEAAFIGDYVNDIKFSPNGLTIMLHSNEPTVHIVDAFNGSTVKIIDDMHNNGFPVDVNYSPEGSYIFAGSYNGNVHVWKTATGEKISIFKNVHSPDVPILCIKHNPRYMTLASASDTMVLWNPMAANYNYMSSPSLF